MINVDNNKKEITLFIQNSIEKFKNENEAPTKIGIYCCPWMGWITTNYCVSAQEKETANNCPDFEFVEFDFLELSGWHEEYEKDQPEFQINGAIVKHDHDMGDESINELIFHYLKPIVIAVKQESNAVFLLQMLDSGMVEIL